MTADHRRDAALVWVRRIADPDFSDWDAHLAWLEADPSNAEAFDDALLLVERATAGLESRSVEPVMASPTSDNDNEPPLRRTRFGWAIAGGAAMAAGLVAVVAYRPVVRGVDAYSVVSTRPGETRDLRLIDGSLIALNGSTVLRLDRDHPRRIELVHGDAFFTVAHRSDRFTVAVGGAIVEDVGTEFDISYDEQATAVAVRNGAVVYNPGRESVRLNGGQAMRVQGGEARISRIAPAGAGGWRHGRLTYEDAPLDQIAVDLSRSIGAAIIVDHSLDDRRFTGVIAINRSDQYALIRIAQVLGVALHREGKAWRMGMPSQ